MDLKLTELKLYDEICGALDDFERLSPLSYVDIVLKRSKVIEETTLMRERMQIDESNSKKGIEDKYGAMDGKYN